MNHEFVPFSEETVGDATRLHVCKHCDLRHVVNMSTGKSVTPILLELVPDCDIHYVMSVMLT